MTTREVRSMLGGLSQQRVSQLVKDGTLVAERDLEGRLQYDRASVERYMGLRAQRKALDAQDAEERHVVQTEARERFARERKMRERAERDRLEKQDALYERIAVALERLARCGK